MNIEEIARNIVNAFRSDNETMLKQETKKMLHQMNFDESMFSVVRNPYIVAKSLYFMLTQEYLSEEQQVSTIKLCYFCLLKNYLKNMDRKAGEPEYEDLVSGCKLALVLISMQNQYLMYSVIAGLAQYINPQTHIRNQVLLFGGIVKEADEMVDTNYVYPLEGVIKDYYLNVYKELDGNLHLPTGRQLAVHKENCTPIIKNIATSISINLKEPPEFDF